MTGELKKSSAGLNSTGLASRGHSARMGRVQHTLKLDETCSRQHRRESLRLQCRRNGLHTTAHQKLVTLQ
jgi:hypothetical protein